MTEALTVSQGRFQGLPRWAFIGFIVAALALAILLLAASFPFSVTRSFVEKRASSALGVSVHIGGIRRLSGLSLTPKVEITDVVVGQPAWAGRGYLLKLRYARVQVSLSNLLRGHFSPTSAQLSGLSLSLVRDVHGRTNWPSPDNRGNVGAPTLSELSIEHSEISVRDDKRHLNLAGTLNADRHVGVSAVMRGRFHDSPASLNAQGGVIAGIDPAAPYPFRLVLTSDPLTVTARGWMRGVLDVDRFTAVTHARGANLKYLDDLAEAGLFGTQEFDFSANLRRDRPSWFINDLSGRVGRSYLKGSASITRHAGRTKVNGQLHASRFDFQDFASEEGLAKSRALLLSIGPRIVPDTRINLSRIGPTDGTLIFVADKLLANGPSPFETLSAKIALDHRVVKVTDIVARMGAGRMTGNVVIDHASGAPKLRLDLRVAGETLESLVGRPKDISGPVRARIVLAGSGDTIREALGASAGHAAIVSSNGQIRTLIATALGQDLGKTVGQYIKGGKDQAAMPCFVANFSGSAGVLHATPLVFVTAVSGGQGSGQISLANETIRLAVRGAAINPSALRLTDPVRISGTLSKPVISVAGSAAAKKPAKTILSVLGKAVGALFSHKPQNELPHQSQCPQAVMQALR
ncbi:hypothetical protein SPAN111604_03715 [Sphingomonas antarctica]|uniref:AsmA family protein n=1 Tax=Sphingomonas antarctica TaxID=2040274 RepID=UPI0039E9BE96